MRGITRQPKNSILHPAVISFTIVSTLLNIFLSMLVRMTDLPFYVDTVGTIVSSALGGIVPGIITAFITNTVNFFMDGQSVFYAPLNMLIALTAAGFFGEYSEYGKKKKYSKRKEGYVNPHTRKRLLDLLLFSVVLGIIGGVIGGLITWFLYRSPSEDPLSVVIRKWIVEHWGWGDFSSHLLQTFLTDWMDKIISVIIAVVLIHFIPQKVKEYVRLSSWRQKPLSIEEEKEIRKKLRRKTSIGLRINIIVVFSTLIMSLVAFIFSIVSFRKNTIQTLSDEAEQASKLAAAVIDPTKVDRFINKGESSSDYLKTKGYLSIVKESSKDIAFLYAYKIEENGCVVIFDLDGELNDGTLVKGDAVGTFVTFEDAILDYREDLLEGKEIPVIYMEDEYGKFYTAYYPVYDNNGKAVCYVVANVDARLVYDMLEDYSGRLLLLFAGFFVLIVAMSLLTTRYHIVMPIIGMTAYANNLVDEGGGANDESLAKIEELDIHTGDEIEQLYKAFCKLTGETVYQLTSNQNKTESISKMQNVLIITMADMVENRDSDTGAHILKTSAYVRIIVQGLKRNGYYAEKINDKYMRDVEMSAPLHDVGKINIPDAILNKPGRLTEEEFAIMKTHTTAGKAILEHAINSMEGDNYLKEARNMAAYHHERWDGKGYPEGLHGEVIPLSARIMAVADVFDALASPRVYKKAFTFAEAVEMIREGSGTQFDPKCVEAFMESLTEVKKIYNKYKE